MPIFSYQDKFLSEISRTRFNLEDVQERRDLQAALRKNISVIADDLLIISEEFSEWSEGRRSIDLLAIDKQANIVVIELKRTETGDHMELQAIRYAAMISTLTWKSTVDIFRAHLTKEDHTGGKDAEQELLGFLDWEEANQDDFGSETHIVLVSANFSNELTTSVMWLNAQGISIKCIQISPYKFEDKLLINVQQIIPLPETEDYQIKVRKKEEGKKSARSQSRDFTKFIFNGKEYNKRKLVLAVIQKWVEENKPKSLSNLTEYFPQELGPRGLFSPIDPPMHPDQAKRYFLDKDELIKFGDGSRRAISNQWGGKGHEKFVKTARDLGFEIEKMN